MTIIGLGHPPNAPFLPKASENKLSRRASEGDLKKFMARRPSETRQPAVTRPLPAVEPAPPFLSNQPLNHLPLFTVPNYFLRDSS